MSVKRSNFTLVFFKATCRAKPGAVRKRTGSSSNMSSYIRKFLSKSANNNVLL